MKHFFKYGVRWPSYKVAMLGILLATPPAFAAEYDILALGDSLTQGYGLLESDGFVPQLRHWLAERGHDVRVVNGGVSGDTTAGGLSRVEWILTPEIDAMIVTLGGNDVLRGIDPQTARANIDGILAIADAKGLEVLLIGLSAPGNFGADYQRDFNALYPELAEKHETAYLGDFFEGLRKSGKPPAELMEFMQADGIHPNPNGVALIVDSVGPKVEELLLRVQK